MRLSLNYVFGDATFWKITAVIQSIHSNRPKIDMCLFSLSGDSKCTRICQAWSSNNSFSLFLQSCTVVGNILRNSEGTFKIDILVRNVKHFSCIFSPCLILHSWLLLSCGSNLTTVYYYHFNLYTVFIPIFQVLLFLNWFSWLFYRTGLKQMMIILNNTYFYLGFLIFYLYTFRCKPTLLRLNFMA